jgi:alpha-L-fucosidase
MKFSSLLLIVAALIAPLTHAAETAATWKHPLVNWTKLDSPLVETTPFVFKDKLYLMESWQVQWETPGVPEGSSFQQDQVRIRDVAGDRIVSTPLVGHGLAMTFVWEGRVYVFGSNWGTEKKWRVKDISVTSSDDLVNWTEPKNVLHANDDEHFFNVSVCRGADKFVLLVESDDPRWPAFTFKYFTSDDLMNWTPVPDAFYGTDKYVGGPALYFEGGRYYTLYLQSLGKAHYETRVARSTDLVHWEDAPEGRPFVTFQPESKVYPLRPDYIREQNASDAEICYFQGRTIVYYTGGDQQLCGDLQRAEFPGTPRELLEHFFTPEGALVPSPRQARYQDNQLGAFVHYSQAAYTPNSDMFATPPAETFNPAQLDTDQWVQTAKSFGAKHIVLTAKHHSGYCLWPTSTTEYSIKHSPWKNGQGDVVREFVDSARKAGLSPGLYLSAGDKKEGVTSTPDPIGKRKLIGNLEAYFPKFMEQARELLTNYGPLEVVWLDEAFSPIGADVLDENGKAIGPRYGDAVVKLIRTLQPDAVIMGGTQQDLRWSGSEQGLADYPLWNVVNPGEGRKNWVREDAEGWYIPEANIFTRSHWFWSPDSDGSLKTVDEMLTVYAQSIGNGANLLINMTPDPSGRIPEAEVTMLGNFGAAIEQRYANPDFTRTGIPPLGPEAPLLLELTSPATVRELVLEEDLSHGQRITGYVVEAQVGDAWQEVARGESIGRKRIQPLQAVRSSVLRVLLTGSTPEVYLKSVAGYVDVPAP